MSRDITFQELHNALQHMKKDSSPGEDGLTVMFYLEYWPTIGPYVFASLQHAWNTGKLSLTQHRGLIRLLPKPNKNLATVNNWCPITLLNVDYKLLTKSLTLRLGGCLPDLIHSDQKGFIKGRYAGENILDVYAMVQTAKVSEEEYVLILLDIEKAFDSVSLHFFRRGYVCL